MDPKISAENFSSAGDESDVSTNSRLVQVEKLGEGNISIKEGKAPSVSFSASASNLGSGSSLVQGEESVSKRDDLVVNLSSVKANKGRKSSTHLNNSSGKRKVKVDWTPELHKKFVQAVEQLGVDKAVPSKILELMGIDCLTRHNVASHLQKYRSHRKHLLAREAEAPTWSRRRHLYRTRGRTGKTSTNSWVVPTTGFPQVTSMSHSRPLHVWGHPSANQSLLYMWHNHLSPSPCYPGWAPGHPCPPSWCYHHQDGPAPGMPCFPLHFPPTRFASPPVAGIPPSSVYRVAPAPTIGVPAPPTGRTLPQPPFDSYLSKESIDAVIGDVLSKPWLPLPLGLKPPSIDSVILELQRQEIAKIPPTCA